MTPDYTVRFPCPACKGRCFLDSETDYRVRQAVHDAQRARLLLAAGRVFQCVACSREWEWTAFVSVSSGAV